jgi:hypothetical protein
MLNSFIAKREALTHFIVKREVKDMNSNHLQAIKASIKKSWWSMFMNLISIKDLNKRVH